MDESEFSSHVPVATNVDTDTAGTGANTALSSSVRVLCLDTSSGGTGFLHKSGKILTAEHVVRGANPSQIVIRSATGQQTVSDVRTNAASDLALLTLATELHLPPIPLSTNKSLNIGTQVTTWGFPIGYGGLTPLLTFGHLAGCDAQLRAGVTINRWVVNAAFNSGNSGGPLLHVEDGSVIGVVCSKHAPLPHDIESALEALSKQRSGFKYTRTAPDGTTQSFSEGQVIVQVLEHFQRQTQLVIGYAVMLEDICDFLKSQGVEPY